MVSQTKPKSQTAIATIQTFTKQDVLCLYWKMKRWLLSMLKLNLYCILQSPHTRLKLNISSEDAFHLSSSSV